MEDVRTGRCLDWIFLQLCSLFPRKAVIASTRKHRVCRKARDGMISVAFALLIHQSSGKGSHSIQILQYFKLSPLITAENCRNQLRSRSNSCALSSCPLLPSCIRWMSISVSFPFRTNLSFFTTGYLQLQSVPNSIGF